MSISFDPTHRTTRPTPPSIQTTRPSRSGVSAIPSSIDSRLSAHASSEGFCSWITDWIQSICSGIQQFFQRLFSSPARSATTSPEASVTRAGPASTLDHRLRLANEILDRHFSWERINQANHVNSAMITIMNYNGHSSVVFGQTPTQRTQVEAAKSRVFALLSNADMRPGDGGVLKIVTLLLDGNTRQQHTISAVYQFRGNPEPRQEVERSGSVNPVQLAMHFSEDVSSEAERRRIVEFMRNFG